MKTLEDDSEEVCTRQKDRCVLLLIRYSVSAVSSPIVALGSFIRSVY